ncbi:hypothetical protein V1264_010834 [Littorina saxatilis]|uniref:Uncharacterized protein n=1 Tax=Littorina saxatilis TaxID=31220 RepID=A0AAN9GKC4_9CAEN
MHSAATKTQNEGCELHCAFNTSLVPLFSTQIHTAAQTVQSTTHVSCAILIVFRKFCCIKIGICCSILHRLSMKILLSRSADFTPFMQALCPSNQLSMKLLLNCSTAQQSVAS